MPFSEKVKTTALQRSAFRCCVCKDLASEIHHIIPQHKSGPDTIENAAPLCSSCHDYYGDNPDKIDKIRALRNHWWKMVEIKYQYAIADKNLKQFEGIGAEVDDKIIMKSEGPIMLYHVMLPEEDFYITAHILTDLIRKAQTHHPYRKRILNIQIEGHRNTAGGYDKDAFEIIKEFTLGHLLRFCTHII